MEVGDRARRLGELKRHPSWELLTSIFDKKREQFYTRLAKDLMSGREREQRQLDYDRGFWAGAAWILANPERAEDTFEKAMRSAQVLREGSDS